MEDITTALETGFGAIKTDATGAIAKGVIAGLPIMGLLFGVRVAVRAFKSAAK